MQLRCGRQNGRQQLPAQQPVLAFPRPQPGQLERNPRIGMAYRTWDKMPPEKQDALLKRGDAVLANLETL